MAFRLLLCLSILLLSNFLLAKEQFELTSPKITTYSPTTESIGNIRNIIQDDNGFIWLATATGLYRYDGFEFKKIRLPDNPDTLGLVKGNLGKIWISTLDNGLYQYDPLTSNVLIFRKSEIDKKSLNTNKLTQLNLNGTTLWIASRKGINALNITNNKFIKLPEILTSKISNTHIEDVLPDSKSRLWFTTFNSGVFMFNQLTNELHHFTSSNVASGLTTNKTTRLLEDNKGNIWLGSFNGIYRFIDKSHQFEQITPTQNETIASLMQDSNSNIWIGTWEKGALQLDSKSMTFKALLPEPNNPNNLQHPQVFDIIEDNNKNLWFASSGSLSKMSTQANNMYHWASKSKAPCYVKGLTQSIEKSIWYSCTKDLYQLRPNNKEPMTPRLITPAEIYDIKEGNKGNLWISFFRENYLLKYNPKEEHSTYYYANKNNGLLGGVILDVQIGSQGDIWVGTYADHLLQKFGNLYKFDPKTQSFAIIIRDINVLFITELSPNNLLVTTPNGIFVYDTQSKTLSNVDSSSNISSIDRVNTAYKDSSGNVWLSIFEAGVFVYHVNTGTITKFNFSNDNPTEEISNIVEDNHGNIWFSSNKKIIKYNGKRKTFDKLEKKDGLLIDKFMLDSSLLSYSNKLFFGGVNRILTFDSSIALEGTIPPSIVLTELKLLNKPVSISSKSKRTVLPKNINELENLTLSYKEYLFSLSFALLHYNTSPSDQYAYKLEGIDQDWIYTNAKNRFATYTTLPSGNYLFRFKGKYQGKWIEGRPLNLTVTPPLWRTWQAYAFYILSILMLAYLITVSRIKSLKNQASALELGIKNKTKEIEDKSMVIEDLLSHKKRVFANVSHEFRTPLSLILAPIENLLENETCSIKSQHYQLIKRSSQRLLRMVEQLLELSKLDSPLKGRSSNYSLNQTMQAIIAAFQSAFDEKNITLTINEFEDIKLCLVEDSLEKIVINLLSNALKYTPVHGQVNIEISNKENNVHIEITDNGIGIAFENHDDIFKIFTRFSENYSEYTPGSGIGLALVKELIKVNNGQILLDSDLHKGTCFTVILPKVSPEKLSPFPFPIDNQINSSIQLELNSINSPTITTTQENNLSNLPIGLIIEDSTDMRNFLVNSLNSEINCISASSGKLGLKLALEHLPDIIITDVMMPELDGVALVKKLKENDLTSHIPIIMLSAKSDLNSRLLGWENNVDEYMPKPFHLSELKLRVNNILSIRKILKQRLANNISKEKPEWCGSYTNKKEQKFINDFEKVIDNNYMNSEFKRGEAAKIIAISERQLNRKLSALFNLGFAEYVQKYRLRKATELIGSGLQVNQICFDVGFNSPSYFIKCFKAEYGKTVKQFEEENSNKSMKVAP